jgi:dTMP kinase
LTRARSRSGVAADRFEAGAAEFFERVRQGYLQIARSQPTRVRVIDAAVALPLVREQVTQVLESL